MVLFHHKYLGFSMMSNKWLKEAKFVGKSRKMTKLFIFYGLCIGLHVIANVHEGK